MSLKIHNILTREEAYLGLKSSYTADQSNRRIKARLKNVVLYNNINFAIIYLLLSSSFSYYLYLSHTFAALNGVYFVIYLFVFVISLFYSTLFLGNLMDLNLIEPLKTLPLTKREILYSVTVSWLLYSGLSVLFIVLPVAIVTYLIFRSIFTLIIAIMWLFMVLIFGYSMGMFLSFLISAKSYKSKSKRSAMKQALRAFIVIFIILFWQLVFYLSRYIFGFFNAFTIRYARYWLIFPFSASYSVANTISIPFVSIFTTIIYILIFSMLFVYAGNRLNKYIFEGFYLREKPKNIVLKHSNLSYKTQWLGYLIRTNHFLGRKPQALISFVIPFAFFILLIINIIGQPQVSYDYLFEISLVVVIMLATASLSTMILEGKSYWILKTLPLSKSKLALIKSISEFIIFTVILIIVFFFIALTLKMVNILILLLVLNLLIAAFDTLYFINIYLVSKLKPDTDTITAASFGGNIAGIVMMALAGMVVYLPYSVIYGIRVLCHLSVFQFLEIMVCSYFIILIIFYLYEKRKENNMV